MEARFHHLTWTIGMPVTERGLSSATAFTFLLRFFLSCSEQILKALEINRVGMAQVFADSP
jgi:hypothetical protein